jgi:RNA polymerase sigma factor (sigma-70 family)
MNSVSDMDLVAESLSGNRDAFGHIVSRYQNLICSLAYSATGNLSQSEDLAQETFLAAWKQLGDLREPAKLRAWLCGIARNLIHNALRRQGREPVHAAESLEAVHETPAAERAPGEHAITNEEQAIMWRSLERIPDIYREALVLFYREHQSIETVAQNLELSEDAVKQRLSRGRKLLHEEVAAFVEGALRQSAPGQAFVGAVLSSLPVKTVSLASAGAAKSGGILSFLTLPVLGFLGSLFGSVWVVWNAKNPPQRRVLARGMGAIWLSVLGVVIAQNLAGYLGYRWGWSEQTYALVQAGNWWLFILAMLTCQVTFFNHYRRMRLSGAAENPEGNSAPTKGLFSGGTGLLAWAGMVLGALAWIVNRSWLAGDWLSVGIVTGGGVFLLAWPYWLAARLGHAQAVKSPLQFVPTVLLFSLILFMINWKLDLWISVATGSGVAGANRILPMWIVHVGTLLLLVWVGLLPVVTKPRAAAAA